jgi:hypothetical protein
MGFQLLLSFLAFDIANVPRLPLHVRLLESDAHAADRHGGSASVPPKQD